MRPAFPNRRLPLLALLSLALCASSAAAATRDPVGEALRSVLAGVPATVAPSGRLLDRSLPLVDPERFDGAPGAAVGDAATFRQLAHQLDVANAAPTGLLGVIDAAARARRESGAVPLAWLDLSAHRLRADAFATAALVADGQQVRVARAAGRWSRCAWSRQRRSRRPRGGAATCASRSTARRCGPTRASRGAWSWTRATGAVSAT